MMTLTAANITDSTTTIGYDHMIRSLQAAAANIRGLPADAASSLTAGASIESLGDKAINALVSAFKQAVSSGSWYVADPMSAEKFFAAYKSKDKINVRRALLLEWFSDECIEYTNIQARVVQLAEEAKAEKKAKRDAKKRPPVVETIPVVDTVGFPPTVEGGGIVDPQLAAHAREYTDAPVSDVSIAPAAAAKPARAKREKAPAAPKPEKSPRDKYDGMQLAQLLIEVQKMFGHGTTMANESALRYKLRRGEKQIAAGQKAVFSVSTPSKPSVRFSEERAKQLEALLRKVEGEGALSAEHAVRAGIASAILGEMHDQLAKKSDATESAAAA